MSAAVAIRPRASVTRTLESAAPALIDHRAAVELWRDFRADHGLSAPIDWRKVPRFTSEPNAKLGKSELLTVSFTGMPAATSGVGNACTHSTPGCRALCLRDAGRLAMGTQKRVSEVRMAFLVQHSDAAASLLYWETLNDARPNRRRGARPVAFRGNIVTDIEFERAIPWLFTEWRDSGADVRAYDYAKNWRRAEFPAHQYRLTFSASERHSESDIRDAVTDGRNVAVVFDVPRGFDWPPTWRGMPLIAGDDTDYRFGDPRGAIVALWAKGPAERVAGTESGFVRTF